MPKITALQALNIALGLASLIVGVMATSEEIKSEVQETVEEELNGRDAKLVSPPDKS